MQPNSTGKTTPAKARLWKRTYFSVLKVVSVSISAILGIFCNFGAVLYGVPLVDFKISGTITSKTDMPIRGISLSLRDTVNGTTVADSILTNSSGEYILEFSDGRWRDSWLLRAEDIDGDLNGRFLSKDSTITYSDDEYSENPKKRVDMRLEDETQM